MSLVFAVVFIAGLTYQTVVIVHFYCNREAITQSHCENTSRPELNCKGKCHLQKVLGIQSAKADHEPVKIPAVTKLWFFGVELIAPLRFQDTFVFNRPVFGYRHTVLADFHSPVFIPPDGHRI